jgi:hypothetical protein
VRLQTLKSSIPFLFFTFLSFTARNYKHKRTSDTQLHEKHIQLSDLVALGPLPMS